MCESANTPGTENVWLGGRATGFLWDNDPTSGKTKVFGFLEGWGRVGLFRIVSLLAETRLVSYPWEGKPQFGYVGGGIKATLPTNRDLRLWGPGLLVRYRHTLTEQIPSIAGYRQDGTATGFSPEGFMFGGGALEVEALFDIDVLARLSFLPLKCMVNTGLRFPTRKEWRPFSQYLVRIGVAYVGLGFDGYVEYSFEGFVNRGLGPKLFRRELGLERTWEVAFSENPMYLTVGGRVRYPSGLTFNACVPLLLSSNRGSDIGDKNPSLLPDDEKRRKVKDPFDPWYAKWKVVVDISFPVRFSQTGAEMRRNFLLMKNRNRNRNTRIDLEEKLREVGPEGPGGEDEEEERRRRLEEIRREREQIQEAP